MPAGSSVTSQSAEVAVWTPGSFSSFTGNRKNCPPSLACVGSRLLRPRLALCLLVIDFLVSQIPSLLAFPSFENMPFFSFPLSRNKFQIILELLKTTCAFYAFAFFLQSGESQKESFVPCPLSLESRPDLIYIVPSGPPRSGEVGSVHFPF